MTNEQLNEEDFKKHEEQNGVDTKPQVFSKKL